MGPLTERAVTRGVSEPMETNSVQSPIAEVLLRLENSLNEAEKCLDALGRSIDPILTPEPIEEFHMDEESSRCPLESWLINHTKRVERLAYYIAHYHGRIQL